MTPHTWILELEHVIYRAGATEILAGVDLRIGRGETHALIGPNGAGKSTVFDVISGRRRPQSGRVLFNDRDIRGLPPHAIRRRGVSRAFQLSALFDGMSVAENLRVAALGAHATRFSSDTPWRRLHARADLGGESDRLLDMLGLGARRDDRVDSLPYAQRRLLELGLAFAGDPSLVLLDEPTAGMSRDEARHTVALLRTLGAGKTLLIVEHDMSVVFELAHHISVLAQGAVIASGEPPVIRNDAGVRRVYAGAFAEAGDEAGRPLP
ncbi:ABC transporter ATP-binding protein [Pararobbsia alpina]|uniref:Lipopolysaccharide export system ATP-binding protein LptB n=1 Tax=Pararobbsia alpina TaxID=621374 RepID=A0A6S7BP97_9BURK|nr:ABC transporter ATP-binding protein [Pararobbsia alpina]CAB3791518.1 Lipopolysaccharide export system ATP-binding protein LptB [Pararobbsia alpina]